MKELTYQGMTLTLEYAREMLEHFKKLRYDLDQKSVRPVDVVGKGYVNTREAAVQYASEGVGRFQALITIMEEN